MPDKKNEERRHKRYIVDGIQGNVLYPADLEILNISIDGAAIETTTMLINFIEENKIRTLEKRLAGVRFKIVTPQDSKIDYPYKYEVKKMSLSGMLVETEYALDLNSNYDIELFLGDNVLKIIGRIAYCEKIDSDDVTKYNIGIEFAEVSDNDKVTLKEFLNA